MRLISILIFLCAFLSGAWAQSDSIVALSPDQLFEVIDRQNATVRLAGLIVDDASQDAKIARNAYLPDISANWQVGYLGNGYLTDRNFSAGMAIHNPHFVNNLAVEAMQTIYSGGAIPQRVSLAEMRTRMAELSLDENRQQVRFILLAKLIGLQCQYAQRNVLSQNIDLANQVLDQMRLHNQNGLILENDLTRYELHIANLQLQQDQVNEAIKVSNHYIANCLNYPDYSTFQLLDSIIDENYPMMDKQQWLDLCMAGSNAINKAKLNIEMSNARLKLERAERLPHVAAFAYGQFNSPITIEVPVLNKNFMYWGFGLNVSYNISSLFKTNKKLSQAKIGIFESETQLDLAHESITDQITQAYEAFLTAQSQLRTQRYSLKLANQNYEIVSCRFAEGMALVTDLVDAANVKVAAQTGVENAQSQLLFCLYKLKYISNTL